MTHKTKRFGLLLLCGALVSLIMLAAGLSNLELHSGNLSTFNRGSDLVNPAEDTYALLTTNPFAFLQGFLALGFLILLAYVSARIFFFANRKLVLLLVLMMTILLAFVYLMPRTSFSQSSISPDEYSGFSSPTTDNFIVKPLGQPPMAVIWLVGAVFVLGLSVPILKIFTARLGSSKIADPMLQEAEQAITALQSGLDLKNVILSCYVKMTHSIQEEQGIERNHTMTVREFEDWLEQKGFPAAPVHQLTSLFEKVRYGIHPMNSKDEENAVNSLNEIIQFCRLGKGSQ